ncbi:MAG: zinc ribbon domain-containing protein [Panacagrimonas sp.]
MPVYDYLCRSGICEGYTELRSIALRDEPAHCRNCHLPADRVLHAPQLSVMSAATRTAHATNERSAHEPASTRNRGHGRGCACCLPSKKAATDRPATPKSFPNHRPWMISH